MYELHYTCYWDLLSYIPSYDDPDISLRDESFDFNDRFITNAQARLPKDGKRLSRRLFHPDCKYSVYLQVEHLRHDHQCRIGSKHIESIMEDSHRLSPKNDSQTTSADSPGYYKTGILVLDVVDAATSKLIWRAYCSDTIRDIANRDKNINATVKKAFDKFPPKKK